MLSDRHPVGGDGVGDLLGTGEVDPLDQSRGAVVGAVQASVRDRQIIREHPPCVEAADEIEGLLHGRKLAGSFDLADLDLEPDAGGESCSEVPRRTEICVVIQVRGVDRDGRETV